MTFWFHVIHSPFFATLLSLHTWTVLSLAVDTVSLNKSRDKVDLHHHAEPRWTPFSTYFMFAVEEISITYCEHVCCFSYPACNAHAPCCHLWPAPLYNVFPHYLKNSTIFKKKKITEHKICVLISSTTFFWNISLSKKKWERYDQICTWLSCKIPVILEWNFNFLNSFFLKTQIWNLMKIRPVGAELFHADRWKDRHDEINYRFSQFCWNS